MEVSEICCLENFFSFGFLKEQYSLSIGCADVFYLKNLRIIFHHCFHFFSEFYWHLTLFLKGSFVPSKLK